MTYLTGFANHFMTEAVAGALPREQNSPQRAPLGLYAEQLSGTAFTAPRDANRYSWLYRIRPSVGHTSFNRIAHASLDAARAELSLPAPPDQLRWSPPPLAIDTDFIDSMRVYAQSEAASVMLYHCDQSMQRYFYCADGEWLIVPTVGVLDIATEMGLLTLAPGSIGVIPRGVRYQVTLRDKHAMGYVCENHSALFRLPDLGPIGANGLAHPRHFETPTARFEDRTGDLCLVAKFDGVLWEARLDHSPLDVVAWHGNLAPYRYDLQRFNTINTVSFDHPDPSIFTVLTAPTDAAGVANVDFVIFPPRWMVAEGTFRPPYFHRNIMSEFMGLIEGEYDAKQGGFLPGGASLHNCMSAHGPDMATFAKASDAVLAPHKMENTMAFMFETCRLWRPTIDALTGPHRQHDYWTCWQGFSNHFRNPAR
jgi:homogentisate 1,2-dioxygenase